MKDQLILPKVKNLLEDQEFSIKLEDMIAKELDERKLGGGMGMGIGMNGMNGSRVNNLNNVLLQSQLQQNSNNRTNSNNINTQGNNSNNLNMKRSQQQQNQQGQKNNIPSNMNNIVDISDDSPTERQSTSNNNNNKIQITTANQQHININNTSNNISSDPYDVPNLSLRQVCLCGKSCQMMQPKKDLVFKCCHCHLFYHI